jgi:serine/threonine protein kinase
MTKNGNWAHRLKGLGGDPLLGQQLGNYRVERVIGRGGMAQVYYGLDVKLHRPVQNIERK